MLCRNTEYQEFATEYISSLEAQLQARGKSFCLSPPLTGPLRVSLPKPPPAAGFLQLASGQAPHKGETTFVEWSEGIHPPEFTAAQSTVSTLIIGPDMDIESRQDSDSDVTTRSEVPPPLMQRRSTLCLSKPGPNQQPLKDWLVPGYDIYVVTLQEVTSTWAYTPRLSRSPIAENQRPVLSRVTPFTELVPHEQMAESDFVSVYVCLQTTIFLTPSVFTSK